MKLTRPQRDALNRVCRSNGGGVQVAVGWQEHNYGIPAVNPWRKLWDLGLIQGKANHAHRVVHTPEGWSIWRELEDYL